MLEDVVLELELGSRLHHSRYLAFDGIRAAVVTDTGVFVIHVGHDKRPYVCRATLLDNPMALSEVSCLQMTDTALWLTWKCPLYGGERVNFTDYLRESLEYHWHGKVISAFSGLQSSTPA